MKPIQSISSLVLSRFRPDAINGGAALRNAQNIHGLSELGPVDMLSFGPPQDVNLSPCVRTWRSFPVTLPKRRNALASALTRNARIFFSDHYPPFAHYANAEALAWIRQQEESGIQYDIAVVEEVALGTYVPLLKRIARRVIFDAHNVEGQLRDTLQRSGTRSSGPLGLLKAARDKRLKRNIMALERLSVRGADRVWACSDIDGESLRAIYGDPLAVSTIPNAINLAYYDSPAAVSCQSDWSAQPPNVIYVGSYSYAPNSQAALSLINEVMPLVRQRAPGAKLYLVGRDPTAAMYAAAKASVDIEITGAVADVRQYLAMPGVLSMPIQFGSGTRLKVLEGFAARRPMVSTAKGVEGIQVTDGHELLIRESPADMAEAVIQIWQDRALRTRLCEAAFALADRDYSWRHVADLIRQSTAELLQPDSPPLSTRQSATSRGS